MTRMFLGKENVEQAKMRLKIVQVRARRLVFIPTVKPSENTPPPLHRKPPFSDDGAFEEAKGLTGLETYIFFYCCVFCPRRVLCRGEGCPLLDTGEL